MNLEYNVQRLHQETIVGPVDRHDLDSIRQASIDLVIALHVVHYQIETLGNAIYHEGLVERMWNNKVVLVLLIKPIST